MKVTGCSPKFHAKVVTIQNLKLKARIIKTYVEMIVFVIKKHLLRALKVVENYQKTSTANEVFVELQTAFLAPRTSNTSKTAL